MGPLSLLFSILMTLRLGGASAASLLGRELGCQITGNASVTIVTLKERSCGSPLGNLAAASCSGWPGRAITSVTYVVELSSSSSNSKSPLPSLLSVDKRRVSCPVNIDPRTVSVGKTVNRFVACQCTGDWSALNRKGNRLRLCAVLSPPGTGCLNICL